MFWNKQYKERKKNKDDLKKKKILNAAMHFKPNIAKKPN